jgi:hypothetical protein
MRLRLVGAAFAGALILSGCGAWSMLGYGPARTSYNPFERTIGAGNVAGLAPAWSSTTDSGRVLSAPAVAGGVVYSTASGAVFGPPGELHAFDARGDTNCSGSPKLCAPLWSAQLPGSVAPPAVSDGVVYVGSVDAVVAFDGSGTTNCSGTPRTCSPLWKGTTGSGLLPTTAPAIVNGMVYVAHGDQLYAFDATGTLGCSGLPKTCSPLWATAAAGATLAGPTVDHDVVYTRSSTGTLYAYDATAQVNCSGSPVSCTPLWTAAAGPGTTAPVVASGRVYLAASTGLFAFDAAGTINCSGTPLTCTPLWTASVFGGEPFALAVAKGIVYVSNIDLQTFDAAGIQNCSGTPTTCLPLWKANSGPGFAGSPAVANGLVYLNTAGSLVVAFDASGQISCSGNPKVCQALWTAAASGRSVVVANGAVYVSGVTVHAYVLE